MSEHWREKDWVWRASEGSLRQAVVAAADRIEALEAAVKSMLHFNGDCACTACVTAHTILREGK